MANKSESGLVKEVVVVAIVILILAYFNIDIQTAAAYIKSAFNWIISLIS